MILIVSIRSIYVRAIHQTRKMGALGQILSKKFKFVRVIPATINGRVARQKNTHGYIHPSAKFNILIIKSLILLTMKVVFYCLVLSIPLSA